MEALGSVVTKYNPFDIPPIDTVAQIIANPKESIVQRMRCLFYARHHGGAAAISALSGALSDKSVLLVHEVAYVMGQIGEKCAIPILVQLLEDSSQHCMIRHEAAEAIAAIGDPSTVEVIKRYLNDESAPVRETCELAMASLTEKASGASTASVENIQSDTEFEGKRYNSVDPIATTPDGMKQLPCSQLRSLLLDEKENLYLRYQALFALRDQGTCEACDAIIQALLKDASSALFRHEVAFVLGQIQTPHSVDALVSCLKNTAEHPMARHEAALALGSVASAATSKDETHKAAVAALQEHKEDPEPIVGESCIVALDMVAMETGCVVDAL